MCGTYNIIPLLQLTILHSVFVCPSIMSTFLKGSGKAFSICQLLLQYLTIQEHHKIQGFQEITFFLHHWSPLLFKYNKTVSQIIYLIIYKEFQGGESSPQPTRRPLASQLVYTKNPRPINLGIRIWAIIVYCSARMVSYRSITIP